MRGKNRRGRQRIGFLLILILFFLPVLLSAQDEPSDDIDWQNLSFDLYAPGDQSLIISAGVVFPVLSLDYAGAIMDHKLDPPVGGTGSFAFNYYLTPHLYVGGDVGGMFNATVARNMLFIIYLGGRIGTQLVAGRFEFPFAASLGMSWQTFLDQGHYTMYLRLSAAAFFRATPSWAFGLTSSWFFIPQWVYSDGKRTDEARKQDVYANFVEITISAKYQF